MEYSMSQFYKCGVLPAARAADSGDNQGGAIHRLVNGVPQRPGVDRAVDPRPVGDLRAEIVIQPHRARGGCLLAGVRIDFDLDGAPPARTTGAPSGLSGLRIYGV